MAVRIRSKLLLSFLCLVLATQISFSSDKIFVKNFLIVGNRALNWDEIYEIVRPYKNKYLSLQELKKLTDTITEKYIQKGYITSKAYIPPQNVNDGIIIIKIFEGKIGEIRTEGEFDHYTRDFVYRYLSPLKEEKAFNRFQLEKVLLVLNSYSDLSVRANVKKGSQVGTTDLIVDVTSDRYPFSAAIFYDNYGSEYTSRNRYGINLNFGNLLLEGSTFSLTGIIGDSYDKLHTGSASYQFPLGSSGLMTGFVVSVGNSNIGKELAVLNIKSYSEFYSVYFSYPIFKTFVKDLSLKGSFNVTDYKQSILNQTTTRDRYRYVDVGVEYVRNDFKSRISLDIKLVQGLGEMLDDILGNSSYNTRNGADKTFSKVELSAVRNQIISDRVMIIFKFRGQYSGDTLLSSQNFYIGGPASIKGYLLSQYGGDSGYALSGELRYMPLNKRERLQLALFIESGQVFLNKTAIGQYKDKTLTGAGFGIRSRLWWDISLTADLAFPIDPEIDGDDREYNAFLQIIKTF
ncbi:ShlB/FhaC/HecB family hemolysin secretion/activation protein [Persephonella sp.]